MNYNDVLNSIIDDGIEAARSDYGKPRDKMKLDGAVAGFEECRSKTPEQISALLVAAGEKTIQALRVQSDQYWYWRCRHAEIEWVANVLSCALSQQGLKPITMMTSRGMLKAADILGVAAR